MADKKIYHQFKMWTDDGCIYIEQDEDTIVFTASQIKFVISELASIASVAIAESSLASARAGL